MHLSKYLAIGFLTAATAMQLSAGGLHPSVLTVQVVDTMAPVHNVISTDPVVLSNGNPQRLRFKPIYAVQRADAFGEGYVELSKVSLGGVELRAGVNRDEQAGVNPSDGPRFGTAYFEAILKSELTLKGGFAVMIIYSPDNFTKVPSATNRAEIVVHDLPTLEAGKATQVKFSSALPMGQRSPQYFVQIYDSEGKEIVTNGAEHSAQYFRLRDRAMLRGAIAKYLEKFKGADHAAAPVVLVKPILPKGATAPTAPVNVVFTVTPEGIPADIEVQGLPPGAMNKAVSDAVSDWLFVPQLKAGAPMASRVQVPIQF